MTDSLDDPFMSGLMDKFGHTGYVVWFGIIEIICKENGNKLTGNVTISPAYLRRKLRTSQTKVRQVLDYCRGFARLSVTFSEKEWEIGMSKILEIKDNYQKDLQGSGKKLALEEEVEEEVDTYIRKSSPIKNVNKLFQQFWAAYPKKKAKGQAEKTWSKIKPDEELTKLMVAKIEEAKLSKDWKKDGGQFIPYPSTWLNTKRWEDEEVEPSKSEFVW